MNDGATQVIAVGHDGEDVPPHGGVEASAVVDDDHAAGRDLVDIVADALALVTGGHGLVANGVGAAAQGEVAVDGPDAEALPGEAEPVQRVADGRGAECGERLYDRVVGVEIACHFTCSRSPFWAPWAARQSA